MEVDDALAKLGTIGRWQVLYYTMISTACMVPTCFHMLAINYIGAWPEHHCKVAEGALVNETIPKDKDGEYVNCEMYVDDSRNKTTYCTEWQYNLGNIGPTVASEWDLVCDHSYLKDLSQTILIVGVMFGAMICTALSDKFGRKPVFLVSQWAMVVVGVANAFAPNYTVFCVFRFFVGVFQQGIILPSFVMACELFAAKYRTFAGTIIEIFWAVATCFYALLAYLVQNWVHLQLIISLFGLLSIPLYWLLPESVVWLCANNRVADAEKIIRNAAKMNNITMPDKILAQSDADEPTDGKNADGDGNRKGGNLLAKFRNLRRSKKSEKTEGTDARYTILDIFRNRHLTINTLCMAFLWMVVTLVYYGLSLSAGQLAGNFYVNNFITGLVEIPAYTSCFFAMQKFGRRRSLVAYYATAGIALILSQVIPKKTGDDVSLIPLRITFSMIAKFGISGAFGVVALYTPEVFPTTLRSQAMGIASFTGRIGNLMAPFSSLMAKELPWLPGLLYGGLSTAAGLVTLLLPETLHRRLPQTIDDIEQWYTGKDSARRSNDQQEMSPMNKDQLNNDVNT